MSAVVNTIDLTRKTHTIQHVFTLTNTRAIYHTGNFIVAAAAAAPHTNTRIQQTNTRAQKHTECRNKDKHKDGEESE